MNARFLAALEGRVRGVLVRLPSSLVLPLYSRGRRQFLDSFSKGRVARPYVPPTEQGVTCWGLRFRVPLLNAAGMFKTGDGYRRVAGQGAGAYLAGTTTGRPRQGNTRCGIHQPFAPYPKSGAASNWLGLPNPGHRAVAERLAELERVEGCPVGVSLAADPDPEIPVEEKLEALLAGLELYRQAGVDFLEINESCPNTEEGATGEAELRHRLERLSEGFLAEHERTLPVVVKFSNDTEPTQVPALLDLLFELGFDGVNFGNTSIAYDRHRPTLHRAERSLFDRFRRDFGGGLSGRPLKADSLALCEAAVAHRDAVKPGREFHIVRTGGVETGEDVRRSLDAGVSLCQWYTGYFEAFGRFGDGVYQEVLGALG
jgi:dihydroorotate dehydrogenase